MRRRMMIAFLLNLMLVFIGITDPLPQSGPSVPQAVTREERWRQDLQHLATELPRRHKNLFFKVTQKEFERAIAELDKAIPSLQDHEIIVGMMRITAMIGDAHTSLNLRMAKFRYHPLSHYWFKDGLYVTATVSAYARALGCRLVQIGETDIERASAAVSALISHENEAQLRWRSPGLLVVPEILQALKILPNMEKARFVFKDRHGESFALELAPVSPGEKIEWVDAPDPTKVPAPLYKKKPNVNYWFEYLEDSQTLYVKYNRCFNMTTKPFDKFAEELLAFADSHPVRRLVIDLRDNGGGDSAIFAPLVSGLKQRPALNQRGRLFAIIGRRTFSSAILNALQLRKETQAIFVGEPTGGKPNHYGELNGIILPNSGLGVLYSTKYFKRLEDDPPSLIPDITVELSSADYFAGRDPVLETILKHQEK